MIQNGILGLLQKHPIIPVVTINSKDEIEGIIHTLSLHNINCIEVTLRTEYAFEAIQEIKKSYGNQISVGVGTIVNQAQIKRATEVSVDFMVSPGINADLAKAFETSGVPFIPGVATPSDIITGLNLGWNVFKFFPANLFGGEKALQTYSAVFPNVTFCPTGGIDEKTFENYLSLKNVVSVGGSWMMK
jgi:2-dehydro-3-deoxyphosphogluconate aldolase / (4S)-4-hydroxy-2-oxoglutarate aldolase